MTTVLETQTMRNVFLNTVGLPAPDEPTPSWINLQNISRNGKDTLLQSLREQKSEAEMQILPTHQYKPQSPSARRIRRPSKPYISRDEVSPERAQHLERNRAAASKCRSKKKQEHLRLQSMLDAESEKRKALLAEVNALEEEIWHIKNQVFEHATICDSQQVSLQLMMIAQNKVLGANSDVTPQWSSPTGSTNMCWDESPEEADHRGIESQPLENVAGPARKEFADRLFDSLVDVPCI
ncbi:hypothetical protein PENDEC_c003G04743 [Penicillium decumbens]|uniref:BZIP domain-containing protein n=1 Tax=Penicillium decumbens TaxID=69771 RepID=A0A1V6PJG4_PENDC|nr:hypothetical protein PENDEC_c003G04743 [Penicillium decumbens]